MKTTKIRLLLALSLLLTALPAFAADMSNEHWVATWGASPFAFASFGPTEPPQPFSNQTLREKLRISVGGNGNNTRSSNLANAELTSNLVFITGVYVLTGNDVKVIATLGDSITDGTASTPHTYNSWPDQLAARIEGTAMAGRLAVVNEGISGNQVLRDGTGGLQFPGTDGPVPSERSADDIIAGYRQLIARAHANGVKIFGSPLTPFEGALPGYYTPEKDEIRIEVNEWIRNSGEFDGVVDFEAAVQDPGNPRVMKAEYNSGDNLHPGDTGYRNMAESIDLNLFQ